MSTQLDPQGKKLEAKQAFDTDTVQLKYKGKQKQFKLNAEFDNIGANTSIKLKKPTAAAAAKKLIHKRKQRSSIGTKSKNTNQNVGVCVHEQQATEAASKERKRAKDLKRGDEKQQRSTHACL